MNETYKQLVQIRELSEEVNGLLYKEQLESVFEKLKERGTLLGSLRRQDLKGLIAQGRRSTVSGSMQVSSEEVTALIKQILTLDKKNAHAASAVMKKISYSIKETAREKQTMRDLQTLSKVGHRQIVDVRS